MRTSSLTDQYSVKGTHILSMYAWNPSGAPRTQWTYMQLVSMIIDIRVD